MADRDRLLVETYAKQQATITDGLIRFLLWLWLGTRYRPADGSAPPAGLRLRTGDVTALRDEVLAEAIAAGSASRVDAALSQIRRLSRSYAMRMLDEVGARPAQMPPVTDSYERSTGAIVEVYRRPGKQFIRELATGHDIDQAIEALEVRLREIVEADVAMTARDEVQRVWNSAPRVIGYRRIIHPELSKTGVCGLCVVAASQFYKKTELMPLHDHCKCTQSPITATQDLGLRLNREDLDALYNAAGSSLAEDLKRIRPVIREHGELGPILVQDGHHFRDVAEVNRDIKARNPKFTPYKKMTPIEQMRMWDATKATSEAAIEKLEAARDAGTNLVDLADSGTLTAVRDIDTAIGYHRELIARANRHLGF